MGIYEEMIHPIYFSCRNDLKLLYISLQTLAHLERYDIGTVRVFFDKANTPTEKEVKNIQWAYPDVTIHSTEFQARGGPKMFRTELSAYRDIAGRVSVNDWLMKCDCDTFWLKPDILDYVSESRCALVGHTSVNLEMVAWTQGGCYFLRADAVNKLDLDVERLETKMIRMFRYHDHTSPEDLSMFLAVLKAKLPVELTHFYEDSLIHFCSRKNEMIKLAQTTEWVDV